MVRFDQASPLSCADGLKPGLMKAGEFLGAMLFHVRVVIDPAQEPAEFIKAVIQRVELVIVSQMPFAGKIVLRSELSTS